MIFNASNLNKVLTNFNMQVPTQGPIHGAPLGADLAGPRSYELNDFFEGGIFNRETFDKEVNIEGKQNLGDALEFAFGKNSKNYTDEALRNAGEAYNRTGQVGLGTFATPTHSSSLLMETMDKSVVASAFGGAAIGGITGAAMGNDSGESAVYGGVAGAAMFAMGRGLRSGTFMEQIEKRAVSSVLGKNYDELSKAKTDVYNSELEEIGKKETYDNNRVNTAQKLNDQSTLEENALDSSSLNEARSHIKAHEQQYGNVTRQDALKQIDQVQDEIYIDENGLRTNNKKAIEEEVARNAAAGQDISSYYNKDGSLKTGRQKEEEAYAKASKDYDADIESNEAHLIDSAEMQKAETEYANDLLQRGYKGQKDYANYREQQRAEALKNHKGYQDALGEEKKRYEEHIKAEKKGYDSVFDDEYIKEELVNDVVFSNINYKGSPHEKDLLAIRKVEQAKNQKNLSKNDIAAADQARNRIRQRLFKEQGGEYEDPLTGQKVQYSNIDELNAIRKQHQEDYAEGSFVNHPEYDTKYKPNLDKKADEINNRPLPESAFDRAKAKKIEEEKKLFDEQKKQASEARTKENDILQEEIDKNTILYNEVNRLTGDPSTFDINERIKAKGYDKVDDDLFYNNLNPGKENEPLDVKKKFNKEYKEKQAEKELREERAKEYNNRTQSGGDLEPVQNLGMNEFKFQKIEAHKEKQKFNNENFDENYGTFVNSFEKNKQEHLKLHSENIDSVIKMKEDLKQKKDGFKKNINDSFDKLEKSQELVDKYKNPKNFSNLNEILTDNGKQTAPAKPFSTIDEYADPKQPGVFNTTKAFDSAPSTMYGYRLMPNEYSARENMLKNSRGDLPSLANKELLQEAVAAKPSSFMGKQAQKLLRSGPDHNIGMQTRHMVLGGSMLAGAAFGSKRKDHSRGFNSHRGNRI